MIPGPIAVVLVALAMRWLSPETATWRGVLIFCAVGIPTWAILHVAFGRVLKSVAAYRRPLDAQLLEVSAAHGGSPEAMAALMADPVYLVSYIVLVVLKWFVVVAVGQGIAS